ncbi:hypothetical protein VBL48_16770 [Enterobacter hormaechei]|nr:hypothetical protein [Enterobacter hormaechei]
MKKKVSAILLGIDQIEAIKKIQEKERERSALGVAPTIHAIARGLMDRALSQIAQEA